MDMVTEEDKNNLVDGLAAIANSPVKHQRCVAMSLISVPTS